MGVLIALLIVLPTVTFVAGFVSSTKALFNVTFFVPSKLERVPVSPDRPSSAPLEYVVIVVDYSECRFNPAGTLKAMLCSPSPAARLLEVYLKKLVAPLISSNQ